MTDLGSPGSVRDGQRAIFLDRDGVLNVYLPGDYVTDPDRLVLLPGVGSAVRELNRLGFRVYVISNQQGVAKGLMRPSDLDAVDAALHRQIAQEGGRIQQSYYCTHASAENCDCRKPQPGLILAAAHDHHIDLATSFFVGDTETDALAARAAGVGKFVLVLTGKHSSEAATDPALFPVLPDFVAANLTEAVMWIGELCAKR